MFLTNFKSIIIINKLFIPMLLKTYEDFYLISYFDIAREHKTLFSISCNTWCLQASQNIWLPRYLEFHTSTCKACIAACSVKNHVMNAVYKVQFLKKVHRLFTNFFIVNIYKMFPHEEAHRNLCSFLEAETDKRFSF